MSSRATAQPGTGPPSTPTRSLDCSDGSPVRRSPRSKEVRTPYYLPLSEHPINAISPAKLGRLPVRNSPSPSPTGKQAQPPQSVDSQRTTGRQRRTTAAAALLRIQGKMKPPSGIMSPRMRAAVSAAVSAVESKDEHLAVVSTADGSSSLSSRKLKSSTDKAPSTKKMPANANGARAQFPSTQPTKKRKAKELVQAVVKAHQPSASAPAQAPQRGRAAVKHKQDTARAAAAGGKLVPAAVPAMHAPVTESTTGTKKKARTARVDTAEDNVFPCGAVPWTDSEVSKLHHVCTHKVPPNSLRYWQQVAMHMPGRTVTECYEKFNETHSAPKHKGRTPAAPRAVPSSATKSVGESAPKTECQKRKFVRQLRWQVQQSQQNDPERLQELMRQQQVADACIDAIQRRRPNTKPQPIVGTISKNPPAFGVIAALENEELKGSLGVDNATPKARTKARRNRVSELPDISEALQVMNQAQEAMLESPDADFYFSDGLSE